MDLAWKDHALQSAVLRSTHGTKCKVRYGENVREIQLKPGGSVRLDGMLRGR